MHLKTFHATSIQEAIRQARQELGPDAMLLNSRKLPAQTTAENDSNATAAQDTRVVFAVTFATSVETTVTPRQKLPELAEAPTASATRTRPMPAPNGDSQIKSTPTSHQQAPSKPSPEAVVGVDIGPSVLPDQLESKFVEVVGAASATEERTSSQTNVKAALDTRSRRQVQSRKPARAANPVKSGSSAKASVSNKNRGNERTRRDSQADVRPTTAQTVKGEATVTQSPTEKYVGPGAPPPFPTTPSLESLAELLDPALPSYEKLFEQMTSMRREMLQLAGSVRRASSASYREDLASEELRWVYDTLMSQEFSAPLVETVVEELAPEVERLVVARKENRRSRSARRTSADVVDSGELHLLDLLRKALSRHIDIQPETRNITSGSPQLVVLVGPPGVGKTTTLVKLAGRLCLHRRFPVQIISMDNYRVAAAEQLRTYASLLGIGFDALPSASALDTALRQYASKELILIDTPGYGWRDFGMAEDLASLLRAQPNASIQLVVSASMKPTDLSRIADLYELFSYNSLICTKLDETSTVGSLVSECWSRQKPLAYLCSGQRIPDDIELASKETLLQRILPHNLARDEFAA